MMSSLVSNAVLQPLPGAQDASVFSDYKPEHVRVSSRGLGWGPLNFERRESPPGSRALPSGSTQHLIFIALGSGRCTRETGGERVEHELVPGSVALVPSRTPVSWSWPGRISLSVLTLEPAFLERVAQSVFGLEPSHFKLVVSERANDTVITNIAGVLAREAMQAEPGGRLYAESLANILAVHLLRNYARCANGGTLDTCSSADEASDGDSAGRSQPRAVADAVSFIQANYAHELSLNDMAEAVHLSPFHLARLFKQALGVSPHQYLIQVRVNSARSLLSAGSGEHSLAEVASAVGFSDQSHLTRHFKRVMGVTPSQFRP